MNRGGTDFRIFTKSNGFKFPQDMPKILQQNPYCVWIAAGHGSINEAKNDFSGSLETHCRMPIDIIRILPVETRVVVFSTDYLQNRFDPRETGSVNTNPLSLYALTKLSMETGIKTLGRGNVAVVRIGSVYGKDYPSRTLPGKLFHNYRQPCTLELPENKICPTPAEWIGEMLVKHYDKLFDPNQPKFHHLAPESSVSVREFGQMYLGNNYIVNSKGYDMERPFASELGCSLETPPTWSDLWLKHGI